MSDKQLLNQLMNYHRDKVDELKTPEQRLVEVPFHLSVVEMLARLDDKLDKAQAELTKLVNETSEQLSNAQEQENKSGEAIDSMERKYWEGMNEAYGSALFVLEREMNK